MGTFPGFGGIAQISPLEAGNALPWFFICRIASASMGFLPEFDPLSQKISADQIRGMFGLFGNEDDGS